jgi:hypothetical protein
MWKRVFAVVGLFLVLPVVGASIGFAIGEDVCDDPPNAFLRCLGEDVVGACVGAGAGLLAAVISSIVIVKRYRAGRHGQVIKP